MKSILVTGGCGFIGSHTCLKLLQLDFNIIIIDSNVNSTNISIKKIIKIGHLDQKEFGDRITFYKGDIRNRNLVEYIFEESIKTNNI